MKKDHFCGFVPFINHVFVPSAGFTLPQWTELLTKSDYVLFKFPSPEGGESSIRYYSPRGFTIGRICSHIYEHYIELIDRGDRIAEKLEDLCLDGFEFDDELLIVQAYVSRFKD